MNNTTQNDSSQIGFRMQYMELLNWGTFNKKIWRIEPKGDNSLLTGSIGSGKSTVVDALTCLLVPHQKIVFNKAANPDSRERSISSYIKGEYKRERDDSDSMGKAITLRYTPESGNTFSIILANFSNEGYQSDITLGVVLWLKENQPQKLFIISKKPVNIKEYFTEFEDIPELKKRLRQFDFIELFDDNFSKYCSEFRRLFGMNSEKALDLFNQTISMKSVKSLTEFVREQMLEKTDIKNQIAELQKRFEDLNKAHIAVIDARRQRDLLMPLVELSEKFKDFESRLKEIDSIYSSIPSYFASKKILLLEEEIKRSEELMNQLVNQVDEVSEMLVQKRKAQNQVSLDIDSNGGKRLKEIDVELISGEKIRNSKKTAYTQFAALTASCSLPVVASEETFYSNLKSAPKVIQELKAKQENALAEKAAIIADQRILDIKILEEEEELVSLKKRKNQIPLEILNIREQITDDLNIGSGEIPFVGELLQVTNSEKEWEGAIERLLRGFGLSMIVPEQYYKQVSEYINRTRLTDFRNSTRGMKMDYFKVPANFRPSRFPDNLDDDSIVNKIDIKPGTPFEEWLQGELVKRFNLRGVPMEEFQRQKDVITKEGQFKTGDFRHTKDDRRELWDRRNFILGWTNADKVKAVEKLLGELNEEKRKNDKQIDELNKWIAECSGGVSNIQQLQNYTNWNDLNWQDEALKMEKLRREKTEIESSSDLLKTLQDQLYLIVAEIAKLETLQKEKGEEKGGHKTNILRYQAEKEEAIKIKGSLFEQEALAFYSKIDELMTSVMALTVENCSRIQGKIAGSLIQEKDELLERSRKIREKMVKVMMEYKREFPSESLELSPEVDGRAEFVKQYDSIIRDGLPVHEARFKKMLNENTVNDIVAFDSKLDGHEKSIRKKIEEINKHLREIEYNKGTYVKILAERTPDKEVRDFKQELKECYSGIIGTEDAYTEDRFEKVRTIMDRFISNDSAHIEWTNKVTDVRGWFVFNASEKYIETEEEKEYYAGTSGKSGGQKEKLAYTVLASALAYQFGLHYGEPRSKSFRFVVIDEAFGRGDDESTQFGLGLFKKLNLQLLIVTPLQKIHVIENYINAVHYVSNTVGNQSEIQNLSVEEYKEEKHLHNNPSLKKIKVTEPTEIVPE